MRLLSLAIVLQLIGTAPKPGHAAIAPAPSDVNGAAGSKVMLFVDVTPRPGIHVYAPGNQDYIPITVKLTPNPDLKPGKLAYPKSETATIADEKVSVYQKPFRLTQDVTLAKSARSGTTVAVQGTVNYQACDDKVCFPPESAPVTWTISVK